MGTRGRNRSAGIVCLALVSGAPALVYQVVWTREIALVAGGHVEAISAVLVAFFGGLALGARVLGAAVDRLASPLRTYGVLEVAAALLAAGTIPMLRMLGSAAAIDSEFVRLLLAVSVLFPATFLLGGTLPALLRAAVEELSEAALRAGWLTAANTAGSLVGVGGAVLLIPSIGLRATLWGASGVALLVGVTAIALARGSLRPSLRASADRATGRALVLAAAAFAGAATLAYEVLVARMAALVLGSSLYSWAVVLALVLAGLALGNFGCARRAARTPTPERDLGWIELAAAVAVAAGASAVAPAMATQATGLSPGSLLAVCAGVLPAAFLMGGAFPFFVRLAVRDARLGTAFGGVSAANTAGGILGALLAPFVLLPILGLSGGALVCAGQNGLLGIGFLAWGRRGSPATSRLGLAVACVALAAVLTIVPAPSSRQRVLFVDHGRQATVVVLHTGAHRDLIVDGDPEASTVGNARATEELLAVLPLLLHPRPQRLLEVGLGSGISVGTAARFPLEQIDCVEISAAVVRASALFAPDNGAVSSGDDPRLRIIHDDGRAFLARRRGAYDVVLANTVHPWSVGATGLYSREYFARMAGALRTGGIAAQWLPLERIGGDDLAAILRTFFAVFPHGGVWWGAENLIAVGSAVELDVARPHGPEWRGIAEAALEGVGVGSLEELARRRLASAAATRSALGSGELLSDDRPRLEARAAAQRSRGGDGGELAVVERIVRAGAVIDPVAGPLLLWIESRRARQEGDVGRADGLEQVAIDSGVALARQGRAARRVAEAAAALAEDRSVDAVRGFRSALTDVPEQRDARFGLAVVAFRERRFEQAREQLERLLETHPRDAEAWSQLGVVLHASGDAGARAAFERSLEFDPYLAPARANLGLLAAETGDHATTRAMLARLRDASPLGDGVEERALVAALEDRATP